MKDFSKDTWFLAMCIFLSGMMASTEILSIIWLGVMAAVCFHKVTKMDKQEQQP